MAASPHARWPAGRRLADLIPSPSGASILWLAIASPWMAGCANHIRFIDDPKTHTHREEANVWYRIKPEGLATNQPMVAVRLTRRATGTEVTSREVHRTEEVTPYSPFWELFEIPAGAVALPAAFGMALVDFVTGVIPNESIDSVASYAFAGMNPFLNIEGGALGGRREDRDAGTDVVASEKSPGDWSEPVKAFTLEASFDGEHPCSVASDPEGVAEVDLLALATNLGDLRPRFLVLRYAPSSGGEATETREALSREFAERLLTGGKCLHEARQQWDDPERSAECVNQLAAAGFDRAAAEIEDRWLHDHRGHRADVSRFSEILNNGRSLAEKKPPGQ